MILASEMDKIGRIRLYTHTSETIFHFLHVAFARVFIYHDVASH